MVGVYTFIHGKMTKQNKRTRFLLVASAGGASRFSTYVESSCTFRGMSIPNAMYHNTSVQVYDMDGSSSLAPTLYFGSSRVSCSFCCQGKHWNNLHTHSTSENNNDDNHYRSFHGTRIVVQCITV